MKALLTALALLATALTPLEARGSNEPDIRATYEAFAAAQNARDLDRVRALLMTRRASFGSATAFRFGVRKRRSRAWRRSRRRRSGASSRTSRGRLRSMSAQTPGSFTFRFVLSSA